MKKRDAIALSGVPTRLGRLALAQLRDNIQAVLNGHNDNTNMSCRIDLDSHDCCYICNAAGAALVAALEEMAEEEES